MTSITKLTVRYAETDKMGIVYYTNYGVWYEIARTNYIKDLSYSYSDMEKKGIMLPVRSLNIEYLAPTYYDDNITIETIVSNLSVSKIEFAYSVYRNKNTENANPVNTGSSVHVFVNSDMKIINLKRDFPEIYSAIENSINQKVLLKKFIK